MKNIKAHLAVLCANIIYGVNYTVAKEVMPFYIKPFGFILIRVAGAMLMFRATSIFFKNEKIERKDFGLIAICALFGVAVNQLLFFKGLDITTPINASIIMVTNPILVLIAAIIILKDRLTWAKIIGIALGISGALLLILNKGNANFADSTALGDLFIFINATSYAIYLVLVKPLMKKYSPLTLIKWIFTFGFIYVLPFGYTDFVSIEWSSFSANIYYSVAFVVVGTTFFAYLLNIYALKNLSSTVVSTYIYSQPLIASIVALSFNKDELNTTKLIATVLIFAAVYLVGRTKRA